MPRGLVIALAAVVVAGVAVVEGLRSNRWGPSDDMKAAVARLERVPREVGEWVGADDPLDRKVIERAEAAGIVSRRYTNRKTGQQVSVLLLCGPSGPIGAHTPDICYGGLGYECVGQPIPTRVTFPSGGANFWTARFEKTTQRQSAIRVYWAWGADGDWEASANPRTDFALRTVLYKLYVAQPESPTASSATAGPAEVFMAEFLPPVKAALTPDPG